MHMYMIDISSQATSEDVSYLRCHSYCLSIRNNSMVLLMSIAHGWLVVLYMFTANEDICFRLTSYLDCGWYASDVIILSERIFFYNTCCSLFWHNIHAGFVLGIESIFDTASICFLNIDIHILVFPCR